jgi:hypothetical protein
MILEIILFVLLCLLLLIYGIVIIFDINITGKQIIKTYEEKYK